VNGECVDGVLDNLLSGVQGQSGIDAFSPSPQEGAEHASAVAPYDWDRFAWGQVSVYGREQFHEQRIGEVRN